MDAACCRNSEEDERLGVVTNKSYESPGEKAVDRGN